MIRASRRAASLLCFALLPALGQACNVETGAREQRVFLEWDGRRVDDWLVGDAAPHRVELPNGFVLGIAIEDAPAERYARGGDAGAFVPELVRIALYDLSRTPARELSTSWGGANSIQGFGAQGGADRVPELGDPGIRLVLLKPVCVDTRTAATPARASGAATPAVPATAAATPTSASPPASAEDAFGRPAQHENDVEEIVSTVPAGFRGWGPNTRIRLANGQEWQIADGSSAKLGKGLGPGVRIVRAAFGSYRMKLDGLAKSPKVRRVK
jgi:hypothetical protein